MLNDQPADKKRRAAIMREAAEWHARLTLETADAASFSRWRDQAADHAVAFARVQSAWEAASAAPAESGEARPPTRRRFLRAAGLTVAGGAAAALLVQRAAAWPRAETAIGERRTIALSNVAQALLNTDSALSWHMATEGLLVRLEQGEVSLCLDGPRPCWLEAGRHRARLSSGQFDVRLRDRRCEVMVSGNGFAHAASGAVARRGELLVQQDADSVLPTTSAEQDAVLSWQAGEILFRDEPLAHAVAEYNRYLRRKIVIADPALASLRIGGRFTSTDPTAFLNALALSLSVHSENGPDGVRLTRT